MPPSPCPPRRARRRDAGFTLIEAALTTVIVGTGVLAIVAAQQAYHAKNNWAQRTGTAMLLANEVREMTLAMPLNDPQGGGIIGPEPQEFTAGEPDVRLFDDLDDFAAELDPHAVIPNSVGTIEFLVPVNALGLEIDDLPGWSQRVTVTGLDATNITTQFPAASLNAAEVVRVQVDAIYTDPNTGSEEVVSSLTWVVPRK